MKPSSKPLSSPGRAEKYPPPLMRFLRSNFGSRSRGRSRASPMFIRKKNNATIETQEPSSPKVTCMGQVRVKRSKKPGSKPVRPGAPARPRRGSCEWIRNALFCHHFPWKIMAEHGFRCSWKKWGAIIRMGCCGKHKNGKDSSKFGIKTQDSAREVEEDKSEAKIFASSSCSSPPKNALILTRCRSAPYRSSSLACKFWGSPLANGEETDETEIENRGFIKEEEEEEAKEENPTSKKESICRNSDQGTRMDSETEENLGSCKAFEENKLEKSEKGEELKTALKTEGFGDVRPLILTRCKSEPTRTAERLYPEIILWKKRKLGFTRFIQV